MKRFKDILKRQQEILSFAKAQGRDLTAEESAEFDKLEKDLENLAAEEGEDETAKRALADERKRVNEILDLCKGLDVDSAKFIKENTSVDEVKSLVIEDLKKKSSPVSTRQTINASVTEDEEDRFRAMAVDGILMRGGVQVDNAKDGAEKFAHSSLRTIAEECLSRTGDSSYQSVRFMSSDELYTELGRQFFNPTAAFPAILDSVAKKAVVETYKKVPTTFEKWVTIGSKSDFKEDTDHEYVINTMGDFEEVPESGELKHGSIQTELLPTRKLKTFGKQFTMSRQAFINDDIGIITRMPALYAAQAKKTLDKMVYAVVFNNGKIFDGNNLFDDAKHANHIATGTAPTRESLQKMITKLSLQKDQFGEAIYATPEFVIIPTGYQFDLYTILHSALVPENDTNAANPLYNYNLKVIESPVLNALAKDKACPWFLVANKYTAGSVGVDFLNGKQEPTIRRMETAGQLGFIWDVYLDAGIYVKDYRGIVRNDGVKIV